MNPCELTASVTAIANTLACKLTEDELNLLGVILTQLGDTLLTIHPQKHLLQTIKWQGGTYRPAKIFSHCSIPSWFRVSRTWLMALFSRSSLAYSIVTASTYPSGARR